MASHCLANGHTKLLKRIGLGEDGSVKSTGYKASLGSMLHEEDDFRA